MANKKYKLADSDYWEASGVYDITEGKTQREINAAKVPTSRTVNGKALSANITLSSEDIGDDSGAGGANVKASLAALKGSLNALETAQQYHVGDTFQIAAGSTYFGFVGSDETSASSFISLPKEIGSDVTGFTVTGNINFWGNENGRITGCTIGKLQIVGKNQINISANFPSGTKRTRSSVGYTNFNPCTITFT